MLIVKKLILAPFVLILFAILISQLLPFLKSYDFIFSLSLNTFIDLLILSALICFSSFLFILFVSLSQNLKFTLPASLLFALVPLVFLDISLALILAVAIFVSLLVTSLNLDSALKSYLTFQPSNLLGPAIRQLSFFLILSLCLGYFLSVSKLISQSGFQIPNSLLDSVDTAVKFGMPAIPNNQIEQTISHRITPDQSELLKRNPDLLRQLGLGAKDLDNFNQSSKNMGSPNELTNEIKYFIKDSIQNYVIKPYLGIIPAFLAVSLFLTLQSLTSILNLLIYPLLSATFYLLEKSGFIRFEEEQGPVKKMVV